MNHISIENLTKTYGQRTGIRDLNLSVPPGTVYGFLGPNGSGKTTTIRLLLGFMKPTAGRATIGGADCWEKGPEIKRSVGYIPGDLRMYSKISLRKGLKLFGQIRRQDSMGYGLDLSDVFELDPDVPVNRMSRGMRQKVGLILALAHKPNLLILDEPTTALDPPMQQALYEHLRERAADGTTVFFSSHTLAEVEGLCTRVAILRSGRLVADELLDAMKGRAKRVVTLTWTDEAQSKAVQPPGMLRIESRGGRKWVGKLDASTHEFVQWCAGQPLDDITISPPDLDSVFRSYYHDEGSS